MLSLVAEPEKTIKKDEFLEVFRELGLNEYETRVYSTLLFLGSSKVGKISKISKVPQSKIYGVLEELTQKELVEIFDGRPKEFKAVPPKIALRNLLEKKEEDLKILKNRLEFLIKALKPFEIDEEFCEGIWVQKNEKSWEVLNRFSSMLEDCKKYAFDITRDFSLTSSFRDSLRKCVRNGVKVMAISTTKITKENFYKIKWFCDSGLKLKVFESENHPRVLIIDGKEVGIKLEVDSKKFYFQFLWSRNKSLVKVFDNYAKTLWKIAKPLRVSRD
ncbi:MAG: helix-turn-helix domain-containing protein [Candidatus Aenigmatarchaeota archaeon]